MTQSDQASQSNSETQPGYGWNGIPSSLKHVRTPDLSGADLPVFQYCIITPSGAGERRRGVITK